MIDPGKKPVITIVFGGKSPEHDISLISAQSVLENIDKRKYEIRMIGITKSGKWLIYNGEYAKISSGAWEQEALLENENSLQPSSGAKSNVFPFMAGADVVFPVLHGPNGEDGSVQGLFQLLDIPYVGCGIFASAAGLDKAYSKIMFENSCITQAKYIVVTRNQILECEKSIAEKVIDLLGYPCFVKPSNAGSSVGVTKVKRPEDLTASLLHAACFDAKILIEECIDGREIECSVLGNDNPIASVVGEIIPSREFYDYNAKYLDSDSETVIPARISSEKAAEIQNMAISAFKAIGATGLSRVDFFVEQSTNRVVLNEINTMPGFTSISMYSKLWAASGVTYTELLDRLIELANLRHEAAKISTDRFNAVLY